jgi:DMSO/TMAO reductase YedYZ heme-binding membrane subunit
MLALAITSTKGWQKRLRRNWKRLHRFVYPSAGLVVLHFIWAVKDAREPMRYGLVLIILLAARLPWVRRIAIKVRQRLMGRTHRLIQSKRSSLKWTS